MNIDKKDNIESMKSNESQNLKLVIYPNDILRITCDEVEKNDFDSTSIKNLIKSLTDIAKKTSACGIAAPQIGDNRKVFIAKIEANSGKEFTTFINPIIKIADNAKIVVSREGCLSFPGVFENINRHDKIEVSAFDEEGNSFSLVLSGNDSVVVQHEYDHLVGTLMIDLISNLKKRVLLKKLKKIKKQYRIA